MFLFCLLLLGKLLQHSHQCLVLLLLLQHYGDLHLA